MNTARELVRFRTAEGTRGQPIGLRMLRTETVLNRNGDDCKLNTGQLTEAYYYPAASLSRQ
jgi:hypothetical protein